MSNYSSEDKCVGCGSHISEYHNIPCVYDPDFEPVMYWSDIAQLTHKTQVEKFNWCGCEEQEQFPYDDCPRPAMCGDHLVPIGQCNCKP